MTISFVGAGATATTDGTARMTVPPHASAGDTDLHVLCLALRLDGVGADSDPTPTFDGWMFLALNLIESNAGDDIYQYVFYRIGTPGTVEVTLPPFVITDGAAFQLHYSSDEEFWNVVPTFGDDATFGANYSATGNIDFRDIRPVTDDVVIAITALESTAGSISADALTQSGLTFGTVNVRETVDHSTTLHVRAVDATVTAGTTTADPTYSHTNASSNSGGTIFLQVTDFDLTPGDIYRRSVNPVAVTDSGGTTLVVAATMFQHENNLHIVYIGLKPYSAIPEPAEGWTLLGIGTNGSTASGADTGSTQVVAYYRFGSLADVTEGGTFGDGPFYYFPVDVNTVYGAVMETFFTHPTAPWAIPTAQVGGDSTHGANYSATASGNLGAEVGDVIQAMTFVNTDAGTVSSQALTISGLTLSTLVNHINQDITDGEDAAFLLSQTEVTAGTEAGAPVFTYTNASNNSGTTIFVRLRTNPVISFTATAGSSGFSTTAGRYNLQADNVFPYYDTVNIVRISETGNYQPEFVYAAELVESPLDIFDYHYHYAAVDSNDVEAFYYQMDVYIGSSKVGEVTSNTVTPHADRLADPEYNLQFPYELPPGTFLKQSVSDTVWPVTIGEFNGYDIEGRILGQYDILGNPYPVVITDVMSASRGTFTILIYHDPEWTANDSTMSTMKQLRDLFASGQSLYFQTVWPWMSGIPDFHFMVRGYSVERLNRFVYLQADDDSRAPIFRVTVDFVEVEIVEEQGIIAPLTWDSLAENYALWAQMSAANTTWLDVLNDG